jgi:2-(1,2-epoxy-1,2-dihydrophenyl)acetyl-CoA isomerase
MTESPILVEQQVGYRIITLNRPDRLNAFNDAMHLALRTAIDAAEADDSCRALMLTFPVIAAVNGVAAGAGCNIALACDIVIASLKANFVQSFARVGLVPDSGGSWFLPRLVGDARARGLALLAQDLPAEKAASWGLIWRAVEDEVLMHEANRICEHFAMAPTQGLALIKRALNASAGNTLDAQLDLERDLQRAASLTPDYAEGVRAFMEKRKPNFSGRKGNS